MNNDLEPRDNKYKLKCSNAPTVVAGSLLNPSDVHLQTTLPPTGSGQPWYHYVWCTPGTKTYTFFNFGQAPLPPTSSQAASPPASSQSAAPAISSQSQSQSMTYDVSGALQQAVVKIDRYINHTGDGPIDQGKWSSIFPNTNVELYVQNHAKKKVTYGILGSVFSGLAEAAIDYKHKSAPILFQINDGKWGELGIGYVGILVNGQPGSCQYSVIAGQDFPCEQVVNGTAVGGLA